MTGSNVHQYLNIVERRAPSAPPTTQCRYDLGIHKFDIEMEIFHATVSGTDGWHINKQGQG